MKANVTSAPRQALADYPYRMSPRQAAEYLACSEDLIVRLCHSGEIAAVNVSPTGANRKSFRILRDDVAAFEEKRKS
jgi:excisionase family DNA binding protein